MRKTLENFIKYMEDTKRLSANTVKAYVSDIEHFWTFFGNPVRARRKDVESYISNIRSEGSGDSTIARNLSSLRAFYSFLKETNRIKSNPVKNIEKPKVERKFPEILTIDEVDRLLSVPNQNTNKGLRDKAMLELLYASGIKISELININVYDINLRTSTLVCHTRKIPIGRKAVSVLNTYLKKVRPEMVHEKNEIALFVNCDGKRMSRQGFWKIVKKYNDEADISKEITPHMLRHSFAVHLLENGADLGSIQTLMGLSDPASALVYTKIRENKIADIYRKAHPRA